MNPINTVIIKIYGVILVLALSGFYWRKPDNCHVDSYIREHYLTDCQMMVRDDVRHKLHDTWKDSLNLPQYAIDRYLEILTAVYKVNDTLFSTLKIHVKGEKYTWIPLEIDPKLKWVKQLAKTPQKSGNKKFDALLNKYEFTCSKLDLRQGHAEFFSKQILNDWALDDAFEKHQGISAIPCEVEFNRPRIAFDPQTSVIEFFYYRNVKSDYDLARNELPEYYWKYKITGCKAELVSFTNNRLNK